MTKPTTALKVAHSSITVLEGHVADQEQINDLLKDKVKRLECQLNQRPQLQPHERLVLSYMRANQGRDMARGIEFLVDSVLFTDRPLEPEQREWLVPLIEVKETLKYSILG